MSAYSEFLDSIVCPSCGHEGMLPDGTGWCECPSCGWDGPIPGSGDDDCSICYLITPFCRIRLAYTLVSPDWTTQ